MHLTQSVQTCIIKGCDGFYVPDITGRTMCYKCGPRDMLPAFMPPIRNYGDSSFDLSKSVKGTEFKDVPQSIIDEVDKICRPKDGLYEKWKEVEKAASLESGVRCVKCGATHLDRPDSAQPAATGEGAP